MKSMELITEAGVDIKNKVFSVNGDINSEAYEHVVNCFALINNYRAATPELQEDYDNKAVSILLSTYGGEVYYGLAIYDFLRCFGGNVEIVCCGPVMSAGMIILQGAVKRSMTPNAQLMIHFGSQSADDQKTVEHYRKMSKLMEDIVIDRVQNHVKKETAKKWFKSETYFDATRALSSGLVDTIIGYQSE